MTEIHLPDDDPVVDRLGNIGSLIDDDVSLTSLLGNGHIEGALKALLGISLESPGANGTFAYLMEKDCGARIDLVAFQNANPVFWIETKSSFLDRLNNCCAAARDAMAQAANYVKRIDDPLQGTPAYIVHFLGSLPNLQAGQLPVWATRRFEALGPPAAKNILLKHAAVIEEIYSKHPLYQSSRRVVIFDHGPTVLAIVVRVLVTNRARLGAIYMALNEKTRSRLSKTEGVRVKAILEETAIQSGTLLAKDIILSVDDESIDLRTRFYEILANRSGDVIELLVERNGETQPPIHVKVP